MSVAHRASVAIIGGGDRQYHCGRISYCSAGVSTCRCVEQASQCFNPVGAGINIGQNASRIFASTGDCRNAGENGR